MSTLNRPGPSMLLQLLQRIASFTKIVSMEHTTVDEERASSTSLAELSHMASSQRLLTTVL